MEYLPDINNTIKLLCKKYARGTLIKARIGMRTNGDLHLGNLFPIIASVLIGEKLIARGYKYRLIVVLVDQEINGNKPSFNKTTYLNNATLAQYSIEKIKKFMSKLVLKKVTFDVQFKTVSKTQRTKKFRKLLKIILDNANEKPPIFTTCPKCEKLLKKYTKTRHILTYYCSCCQEKFNLDIRDPRSFILTDHDLLGAIENNILHMNIHILGADHTLKSKGISSLQKRERFQDIIDRNNSYLTLLTPLIYFKGKKMSKSNSNGIFLDEIKKYYKKKYISALKSFVARHYSKRKITINHISDICE